MRDTTALHPTLQAKLEELKTKCAAQGLKIGIGECVRTVAEQDALYAQGRTTSGSIVTNAKGSSYSSMHQWGIAFDFYRNDGTGAYNDKDGFFSKVGKIGQSLGLEWGGAWTSIVDKPHFQLPDWGSGPSKLKKLYGTPEKFMVSWPKAATTATTTTTTATTTQAAAKPAAQTATTTNKEDEDMDISKLTDAQVLELADRMMTVLGSQEPSDWSQDARTWAEDKGVIKGDSQGKKMYKKPVTREELATIAYRLHGAD
jgi:hypothetical protein